MGLDGEKGDIGMKGDKGRKGATGLMGIEGIEGQKVILSIYFFKTWSGNELVIGLYMSEEAFMVQQLSS